MAHSLQKQSAFIENSTRLSQSCIWKRQAEFYKSVGVDAWKGTVPSRVTTSSQIAKTYARLIASYASDCDLDDLTIVELGAGHGRLGFLCAQHLLEMEKRGQLRPRQWTYVLTDIAPRNIEFWKQNESLKPLIASGHIDVAEFGTEDSGLHLQTRGQTISSNNRCPNIVAIGNYFFDSIPIDVFKVEQGELYECESEIVVMPSSDDRSEDVVWNWHQKVVNGNAYEEVELQQLVDYFKSRFDDGCFTIPSAGCRTLATICEWSENDILLLAADKGYLRDEEFAGRSVPVPVPHGGCYSFSVNFAALRQWFQNRDGLAMIPERTDPRLQVTAFTTRPARDSDSLQQEFQRGVHDFGPGDCHQIVRNRIQERGTNDLNDCLATIQLAAQDDTIFYFLKDRIRSAVPHANEEQLHAVGQMLDIVLQRHFVWGTKDIPFAIAHIWQKMERFENAIRLFSRSLHLFGEHHATLCHLAECLNETGQSEQAAEFARRSLELRPQSQRSARVMLAISARQSISH